MLISLFPTPFDHFHFHPTLELKSRVILRSCHMWMQKSFCSDLNDAKNGIAEPQVSVKLFYNRNNNRQKSVKTTTNNHQTETKRGIFLQENCTVSCPGCPLVPPGDKQWQILLLTTPIRDLYVHSNTTLQAQQLCREVGCLEVLAKPACMISTSSTNPSTLPNPRLLSPYTLLGIIEKVSYFESSFMRRCKVLTI